MPAPPSCISHPTATSIKILSYHYIACFPHPTPPSLEQPLCPFPCPPPPQPRSFLHPCIYQKSARAPGLGILVLLPRNARNRAQPTVPKHLKMGEMGKHGSLSSQSPKEGNRLPSPVPSCNHTAPPCLGMCQLMRIKCNVQFFLLLPPVLPNLVAASQPSVPGPSIP